MNHDDDTFKMNQRVFDLWDQVPDHAYEKFRAAVTGYAEDEIEVFEAVSIACVQIRTLAQLRTMCDALRGNPLHKKFDSILNLIGPSGHEGMEKAGINPRDHIRAWILLLIPTVQREIDDLVETCFEYGTVVDKTWSQVIRDLLRVKNGRGKALLVALGIVDESSRESAELTGKSHVACARKVNRLKRKLSPILCHRS
jgi:hypothetical protein